MAIPQTGEPTDDRGIFPLSTTAEPRPSHQRHRTSRMPDARFDKVLIAVDSDPIAAHATNVGGALAGALAAEVALIHVIEPPVGYADASGVALSNLVDRDRDDWTRRFDDIRLQLPHPAAVDFVRVGAPGMEIVKAAEEWQADLIVIGSHGRGGVGRALLGSTAETVMRHSRCPVLVVRSSG
jgi:nucleotide-binding universal stress UspA family protein